MDVRVHDAAELPGCRAKEPLKSTEGSADGQNKSVLVCCEASILRSVLKMILI